MQDVKINIPAIDIEKMQKDRIEYVSMQLTRYAFECQSILKRIYSGDTDIPDDQLLKMWMEYKHNLETIINHLRDIASGTDYPGISK